MMPTTFDKHKAYWTNKSGMPCSFAEWLPNTSGLQILDLGCAGGRIASCFQNATVYGIDCSKELLHEAQTKHPHIKFICGDFQSQETWQQVPPVNLIISNCAIRKDYCPNLSGVMRLCNDNLTEDGMMLLRIEDVSDLSEVLPQSLRESLMYNRQELLECLESFDVEIKEESYRQRFSSVEYMQKFLERIQLDWRRIKCLNPTRRYLIVRAKKSN
jgi:trans-aconitate methyltransferase